MTAISTTDPNERMESFVPPGPGQWMLDTTHHGRRPITRFMHAISLDTDADGFASFTRRYGLPLETMKFELVNGYVYARPKPVGEPDRPSRREPPKALFWLLSRVHPELRRRNRAAKRAWERRAWRDDVDDWFDRGGRDEVIAENLRLQGFDVAAATDAELAGHLSEVRDHLTKQFVLGFETHADIIACGDFLAHCQQWGISPADASPMLAGASPATIETRELLNPVAAAVAAARSNGDDPGSVEEIRRLSPEANSAIDRWLELHAWRLLNSDDVDCPTLAEQAELQLRVLRNLDVKPTATAQVPTLIRPRVPAEHRAEYDQLLAEARYALRLRDDNVGIRINWPAGLARRALLEAGRRLVERGALAEIDHAVHCSPDELIALLTDRVGPSIDEVNTRHLERRAQLALDPPTHIGPEEPPPPMEMFPAPMARATAAVLALVEAMQGAPAGRLRGTGVGDRPYTGRACVLTGPDDDFSRLEPGDVLIAPFTSPSFNSLFPLLGAVAVAEGGVMSHTAIVAREFGLPAVVGVEGLLETINHGDNVEVDPVAGTVRSV